MAPGWWQVRARPPGYGRRVLAETPDSNGSLGMAISEAVEDAATRDDTKYALGSVLNHVMLHQTVIGLEAQEQMAMAGEEPDVIIACAGGGSNFAGMTFPYVGRILRGEGSYRVIAAEPEAAPSLTRGIYAYDFGDTGHMAPIVKMHTLGSNFMPEPIHAGGLRYHGMSPLVSQLKEEGFIEARSVHQRAGVRGWRPVRPCRGDRALRAHARDQGRGGRGSRRQGRRRAARDPVQPVGHGHFDLSSYERFLQGALEDYEYPAERVATALAALPKVG